MEQYRMPMEERIHILHGFHAMTDSILMAVQIALALMVFGHI